MTSSKSIEKEDLIIDYCPNQLTMQLIQQLKIVLASGGYQHYMKYDPENGIKHELNMEGQLEFFCNGLTGISRLTSIKQASQKWNALKLVYRLTVLDAFATLYYEDLQGYTASERTIIFCQIFIRDLVDVLTSE